MTQLCSEAFRCYVESLPEVAAVEYDAPAALSVMDHDTGPSAHFGGERSLPHDQLRDWENADHSSLDLDDAVDDEGMDNETDSDLEETNDFLDEEDFVDEEDNDDIEALDDGDIEDKDDLDEADTLDNFCDDDDDYEDDDNYEDDIEDGMDDDNQEDDDGRDDIDDDDDDDGGAKKIINRWLSRELRLPG